MVPSAVVARRGADRIRAGHPWIYRSDVAGADAEPGDLVRVSDERRQPLGWALWSSSSQIALRMMAAGGTLDDATAERRMFEQRLRAAFAYRAELAIDATAFRLVHGEADRLPSLIVDRYADEAGVYLVIQTLSQGMDRRLPLIVELLVDLIKPAGILARNDPKVRRLEGLEERVDVVFGDVPERIEIREGVTKFGVDLLKGQKTGLFLDQRENHTAAAGYARGRALDGFTYQGGFALTLATKCSDVIAVESSEAAVARTQDNAALNQLTNVTVRHANVFDELRELEVSRERFDTVVLDPPAFAKNKASVPRALSGYKEINLRALKLLTPGGHLITCSCSYNVSEALFLGVLEEAAVDARVPVALIEKRQQARDHPVLLAVPETSYLKCVVLRRIP
jgi:23S rRNA (cytosine1962-C5)-methyltransferase